MKISIAIKALGWVGNDGRRDLWSRGGPLRTALNLYKNCDFVIVVLPSLSLFVSYITQMH